MAAGRKFKDNASEETVSIGRGKEVIRSNGAVPATDQNVPTFEIPVEIGEPIKFQLPEPMPTPVLPDEYVPKIVKAKVELERIKTEDAATMDAGCEKLLEYLPEDAASLIREYRANNEVPIWQVIGGYVMRAREQAELFSPIILPDWADSIAPNSIRPCGTCGDGMKAAVAGQQFCCNLCYHGKESHNTDCCLTQEAA